jgi:hypothetical protein
LAHDQEFAGDLEIRMRLRLAQSNSVAEVTLHAVPGAGQIVRVTAGEPAAAPPAGGTTNRICLAAADPGSWHTLLVRAGARSLWTRLDDQPPVEISAEPATDGQVLLKVPSGRVEFDDVEFVQPRRAAAGFLYAFDKQEPDWWREGGTWLDHGGVACVLASSWISLVAPQDKGLLWNKRAFGSDLRVAFDIHENTEWRGWNKHPDHVHYPFDNVAVVLSPDQTPASGYRLEVNAREADSRSAITVLYRQGVEVARVNQDGRFPMRYVGGDAPYHPRKNRISVRKEGKILAVVVNGQEVLRFEDPEPLAVSRVAIGGRKTRINFSHIEVLDLSAPTAVPR